MSNYFNGCQPGCQPKHNSVVSGNSIDIKMNECQAAEVRADVVVESTNGSNVVRLWGQIKDCNGKPVANALLKLVKVVCSAAGTQYQGIAHTVSDCEGFYQFDLCYCDGSECYKVLVSKAYTEPEQVILTGTGNCKACEVDPKTGASLAGYQPCRPYDPVITQPTPGSKCGCEPQPCPNPNYPPCGCNKNGYQYTGSINIPSPCGQ
ncbi:MAG: hypothetical protein RR324_02380 [Cellulosilyticaceae bacterium]